jgi:NDP-sugar pyrophosphorylase family protein
MKGLICAGGTATRLEELTRVTNKHLLPVGHWPMVYYPLQLLQRLGVREVLLVTGQQHAGQFIDLLGNGHVRSRTGDEPLFDLDLSYKVQVEAGGIAQVVGMARDFAAGEQLVVCLGDNIFEHAHAGAVESWGDGALVFIKEVPDPENFGVVVYDDAMNVTDIVTTRRRRTTLSSACTATRPTCSRSSTGSRRRAAASSRSPTSTVSMRNAATSRSAASRAGGTTAASTGPISPTSAG